MSQFSSGRLKFAIVLGGVSAAMFGAASGLGVAGQFNAFILNGATASGGDAQGAVAVGGSFSGQYGVASTYTADVNATFNAVGLYVGTTYTPNSGSYLNNGYGYVAGSMSGQINVNGSGIYVGGAYTGNSNAKIHANSNNVNAVDVASTFSSLSTLSNQLAALSGTAINTSDPNNWSLDASTEAGHLKVFTISASSLNNLRTLNITNLLSTDTLVINVTGTSVTTFGVTVNTPTGNYNQILWNFNKATTLGITQRALHGTVLATNASVSQSQNIDGGLIASSWNTYNGAEVHFGANQFSGNIQSVPEPTSIVALAAGLVGLLRRRRLG